MGQVQEVTPVCRAGHTMILRSVNPRGYTNPACCDVCGLENLVKKRPHYFHCSFCRFDLCPHCSVTWKPDLQASQKQKKSKSGLGKSGDGSNAQRSDTGKQKL